MRTLGCGAAVAWLVVGAAVAPAQEYSFQITERDRVAHPSPHLPGATDVVVTDPSGSVIECWRGAMKPGDVVRLGPLRLTPENALPLDWVRLRTTRTLNGFRDSPQGLLWPAAGALLRAPERGARLGAASDELRLVLLLRNEGTTGVGAVWMPAAAPPVPLRGEVIGGDSAQLVVRTFRDFDQRPDFTTSVALVDAGSLVARGRFTKASHEYSFGTGKRFPDQLAPVELTLDELKEAVSRSPMPGAIAAPPARRWAPVVE